MGMFEDRQEAGRLLARKLAEYGLNAGNSVVLGLPRGGVVVAHTVARELGLPLDIIVARKVGHPQMPEYAICAVDAQGLRICNESEAQAVEPEWLREETARQVQEAGRRLTLYRSGPPQPLEGKTAVIADDGIATGLTMRLAVMAAKRQNPRKIIVAVPVAPPEAVRELSKDAEVVLLEPPEDFMGAVGAHYRQFEQVEDAEVLRLMRR